MPGNAALVNFVAGETSPLSRGRFDISSFPSSCRKLLNFICELAGPARYRPGFKHRGETRGGAVARNIPFQLNDSQAYLLEFTAGYMRVRKDEYLLTTDRTTITAITQASPVVITVASATGLTNGDEVIITGIVGMIELNGRQVRLANGAGSTFQLVDPTTGVPIDSSGFGAYVSGGDLAEVYEIASPYLEADLPGIQFAQSSATMYLTHFRYAPRKLTVASNDTWTLTTFSRTADPFNAQLTNLTGFISISLGTQTRITYSAPATISEDVLYTFSTFVGTTELNGGVYRIENDTTPSPYYLAYLRNADGTHVDSSAWTAYVSGGLGTPAVECPIAVAFYEGRLGYFGSNQRPSTFWLSQAPSDTGASRYDDFTGGTDADDACAFTLAPVSGRVDYITWAVSTAQHLQIGTYGGPFRVSGGGLDEPITPASINVRQIDGFGCESLMPAVGARTFFLQRGGETLRTLRVNTDSNDPESYDMCLNAEHIGASPLRQVVFQAGRPDAIWVRREDGVLAGMTVLGVENIAGWHRHKIGGTDAKVIDVAVLPRSDAGDQLWACVERTVDGATRRSVEVMADPVAFPDLEDFYLGPTPLNESDDLAAFRNAVYRRQGEYVHLDGAGTYDGAARGLAAEATLTPAALSGDDIIFTASEDVFVAGDVGNELWKKPSRETGAGSGRAVITSYLSPTQVVCDIEVEFDSFTPVAAGEWFIAAETITNLWYLEGETVAVVTDGAVYSDGRGTYKYPVVTVANGKVTLPAPAGVAHVGLPYEGFLQTQNLEMGGRSGPAQSKPRNIVGAFIRFLNTLGASFGTNIYKMDDVEHVRGGGVADRPTPVFSGIRKMPYEDRWEAEQEKTAFVAQRLPLPCVVQYIDVQYDTGDE